MEWNGRVDDAANMLACLDVHKTEVMLRRQIVLHLTNDYNMERRALLRRRDLPRSELEEILRDGFAEMQAAKPVGRQNALFAGAQGRGGQGAGGYGGSRRGNRTRGSRGGGRGGKGIQGSSASNQGQPFNGSNGFFSPVPASDECYHCNQPGNRNNECTATTTLNLNPSNSNNAPGQGNIAMVVPPPPPPSSAGPSASTLTTWRRRTSSSSGGQQHSQPFMA